MSLAEFLSFLVSIPHSYLARPIYYAVAEFLHAVGLLGDVTMHELVLAADSIALLIVVSALFLVGLLLELALRALGEPHILVKMIKYLIPLAYILLWIYGMFSRTVSIPQF